MQHLKEPNRHPNSETSRRHFLLSAGLSLFTGGLLDSCRPPQPKEQTTHQPSMKQSIAVQLYTVREQIALDLPGTLRRLADMGFKYVETAFWPEGVSHQAAAAHLRDAGLTPIASHVEIPIGSQKETFLEIASAYGVKNLIWHGWPEDKRYSSTDGTRELIEIYNESARFATENGLRFGLHNHWWEFRNTPGGKPVYEFWLDELDPAVFFELDTYWIKVAGYDPAAMIGKFGSRVRLLHIKDGPARWHEELASDNPDPMTSVGQGAQDMPAILKAAKDHVQWLVVEMDKTDGDVFRKLSESLEYLKKND